MFCHQSESTTNNLFPVVVVLDQIIAGRKQFEETLCDWLLKRQWLDNCPFLPLVVSPRFTGAKEGDICIY